MGLGIDGVLYYPFTKIAANGNGDLQRALGKSDLSQYNLFISGGANVNPWAKYKAFENSTNVFSRYNDAGTSDRDLALKAANYGLVNIPVWTNQYVYNMAQFWLFGYTGSNYNYLPDFCRGTSPANIKYYQYKKPSEWASGMPFRALDFERYFKYAVRPVTGYVFEGVEAISNRVKGHCTIPSNLLGFNLTMTDFVFPTLNGSTVGSINAKDMYFADVMVPVSTGTTKLLVNKEKVSVTGLNLSTSNVGISGSHYHLPFLTTLSNLTVANMGPTDIQTLGTHVPLLLPGAGGLRPDRPDAQGTTTFGNGLDFRWTSVSETGTTRGIVLNGTYNTSLNGITVTSASLRFAIDIAAGAIPSGTPNITITITLYGKRSGSASGGRQGSITTQLPSSTYSSGGTAYVTIPISMTPSFDTDSFEDCYFKVQVSFSGQTYFLDYSGVQCPPAIGTAQPEGYVGSIKAGIGANYGNYISYPNLPPLW